MRLFYQTEEYHLEGSGSRMPFETYRLLVDFFLYHCDTTSELTESYVFYLS